MLRVRTVMTGVAGSPWYTNLYFAGLDQAAANDAYQRTRAFWSAIALQIRTGVTIDVQEAIPVIDPANGQPTGVLTAPTQANLVGGGAAEVLPPATQALIAFNTGVYVAGRQIRGRMFIPGLTENVNAADGTLNPTTVSLFQSAVGGLLDADAGEGLVIFSRKNFLAVKVTTAQAQAKWAVLRSRRD